MRAKSKERFVVLMKALMDIFEKKYLGSSIQIRCSGDTEEYFRFKSGMEGFYDALKEVLARITNGRKSDTHDLRAPAFYPDWYQDFTNYLIEKGYKREFILRDFCEFLNTVYAMESVSRLPVEE